jgi:hypothetical protein
MLQAPPGTRLFDRLLKENFVVREFSGDNVEGRTNIIPQMGLDSLLDWYRSIMKQIYSPNNFYRRIKYFLNELKAPEIRIPLDFQRFLAFFHSGFGSVFWERNGSITGNCYSGLCSESPECCHWPLLLQYTAIIFGGYAIYIFPKRSGKLPFKRLQILYQAGLSMEMFR